jgi:hypothetical protein
MMGTGRDLCMYVLGAQLYAWIVSFVFAITATCFDKLSNHTRYFFTLHKHNHSNRDFIACQPSDTHSTLQPVTSLPLATIFVGKNVWFTIWLFQYAFYVTWIVQTLALHSKAWGLFPNDFMWYSWLSKWHGSGFPPPAPSPKFLQFSPDHSRNEANNIGWRGEGGVKLIMGNLQRSQVRNRGQIGLNADFSFLYVFTLSN